MAKGQGTCEIVPIKISPGGNHCITKWKAWPGPQVFIIGSLPFSAYKVLLSLPPPPSASAPSPSHSPTHHLLLPAFNEWKTFSCFYPKRGSVPIRITNQVYSLLYKVYFCLAGVGAVNSKHAVGTKSSRLVPGRLTVWFHGILDSQRKAASALGRESATELPHRTPITLLTVKKKS